MTVQLEREGSVIQPTGLTVSSVVEQWGGPIQLAKYLLISSKYIRSMAHLGDPWNPIEVTNVIQYLEQRVATGEIDLNRGSKYQDENIIDKWELAILDGVRQMSQPGTVRGLIQKKMETIMGRPLFLRIKLSSKIKDLSML